jgi:hypothetical protein
MFKYTHFTKLKHLIFLNGGSSTFFAFVVAQQAFRGAQCGWTAGVNFLAQAASILHLPSALFADKPFVASHNNFGPLLYAASLIQIPATLSPTWF